jgi:hypothetical protein
MPFALVQGAEPAALFAGGMPLDYGVDEVGYLGALFGEPLELVRCKTVALEVPATAEIIVEGHVSLDETASEGPFGEYHGYLRDEKYNFPVYHISAITQRDNPILPVTSGGKPVEEDHTVAGVSFSAICLQQLRDEGLPVTAAWSVPEAAEHMLAVLVPRDWPQRTALSAYDLSDPRDLIWAWNSRCHPVEWHFVLEAEPTNPIEPMYADLKLSFDGGRTPVGPTMVLNCLLPTDAKDLHISDFANNFPKELQEHVLARWNE